MIFIVSFDIRKRSHFKIQILDSSVIHFSRSDVLAAGFTRDLDRVIISLLHPKEAFFIFPDPETRAPHIRSAKSHRLLSCEPRGEVSGGRDARLHVN